MKNATHRRLEATVRSFETLTDLPDKVQDALARIKSGKRTIAALYWGGTLGMKPDEKGELVPTDDAEELLEPLHIKGLDEEVQVVWFPIYPKAIDSTNGRWPHWVSIGNAIRTLYDHVDGFVVCSGTDTMSFVLAALNFMFPNIGKPIVGTGAQLPMIRLGDDATRNLYVALAAASSDLSGAHLAFYDVLRHGLRTLKVNDRGFGAFDSPVRYMIGDFNGNINLYPSAPRRNPIVTGQRLIYDPGFREGIKVVKISPATSCASLLHDGSDPDASALILVTYGAGNVRDEPLFDGELTHVDAIRKLTERHFPVILGSPMMDGIVDSPYVPGCEAIRAGGISGGDTWGPTLEVKAMRCMARAWDGTNDRLDPEKFRMEMLRDHVGELTIQR